ncbi:MAG TPA: type II toxin-antitoxin system VapC family toxin [Solirubrobacteraceae bacterium]|nr:type II toxin-antitoxin system VapC family toxin [Solirubrobacteraceae bacterium]
MRLLLDTHTFIWAIDERLAAETRAAIEAADAALVSAATIWEIEIKRALGKMQAPERLAELADESGFERIAIDFAHAREAGRLPPLHGDPFDRMLVAQARVERLTLASADAAIRQYDVSVLDVARS